MTLDKFLVPKKPSKAKRPRSETTDPIPTKNKFSNLNEVILKNTTSSPKLPPIFMKASTHLQTISLIKKYITDFNLAYCGNGQVRVQTRSLEDFQKLKSGLKDDGSEFHSFTLKGDKPKRCVVRGLPIIESSEISADLSEKGFKIINIFPLKGKNGLPTKSPLYLINFDPDTDVDKIKNITVICHCKIKIERYTTSKGITQCFRCQQFGHAASNCNRAQKCVKCAGGHATKDCIKEATSKAKCINCEGDHTANYRECPAKKSYEAKTSRMPPRPVPQRTVPQRTVPQMTVPQMTVPQMTAVQGGKTWAQITNGSSSATYSNPIIPTINKESTTKMTSADMPINDLMQLVLKIRDLQIKLKSCRSVEERMYLLLELAQTMEDV